MPARLARFQAAPPAVMSPARPPQGSSMQRANRVELRGQPCSRPTRAWKQGEGPSTVHTDLVTLACSACTARSQLPPKPLAVNFCKNSCLGLRAQAYLGVHPRLQTAVSFGCGAYLAGWHYQCCLRCNFCCLWSPMPAVQGRGWGQLLCQATGGVALCVQGRDRVRLHSCNTCAL